MGHANTENISRVFNRLVHRDGGATINEIVAELERTKQAVHASEGDLEERYMLSLMAEQIAQVLFEDDGIEPVRLTRKQAKLFKSWKNDDDSVADWDSGDDGRGGEYGVFDSIRWRALKKRLPVIRYIEN